LEIPDNNPIGGNVDGMDDMDAPMPPMGSDDMGGAPDDMMGGDQGMDDMGGSPDDMGGEPNDMGGAPDDMGGNPEDDELMDIINSLSIEDKAAVTKYAKSMADDNGGEEPDMGDGMMPESKYRFKKAIDETIGALLDKKKDNGIKRPGKKLNSKFRDNKTSPFVSPF
jgi:hypothetical protein